MIVYRVENAAGDGMYRDGQLRGHVDAYDKDHPGPGDDGIIRQFYEDDWDSWTGTPRKWGRVLFGFSSMEQLKVWVKPWWREELARTGQRIAVYDAPDGIAGTHQAIFDRDTATLVSTASLTEIDKQIELPLGTV